MKTCSVQKERLQPKPTGRRQKWQHDKQKSKVFQRLLPARRYITRMYHVDQSHSLRNTSMMNRVKKKTREETHGQALPGQGGQKAQQAKVKQDARDSRVQDLGKVKAVSKLLEESRIHIIKNKMLNSMPCLRQLQPNMLYLLPLRTPRSHTKAHKPSNTLTTPISKTLATLFTIRQPPPKNIDSNLKTQTSTKACF